MRLVLSWLRELVPVDLGLEELGELLALKGAHVESVERPWEGLDGVVVARVVEVRDHPNADTLCLARVQTGAGEQEVVVGVRNMRPGDLVPLAPPGALLPGIAEPLGVRTIRGVVSDGMLCSPRELGISDDHGGILIIPADGHGPGDDVKAALGLDDVVLDLEIESNRPDLLSVVGLAREVAGATGLPLASPDLSVPESDEEASTVATVEVKDSPACPRYSVRVIRGLGGRATPLPVQARLTAAGVRPISAPVDATNYAMLETGQPLHAFDLALLAGPGIVVRRAEEGERLTTLDGVERALIPDDLLICDVERAIAIAGIMGGSSSEVGAGTRDVLLESAYFEPRGVLRTSRRLQLLTEASIRFSRGADPEITVGAASLASRLMVEWSEGGRVLRGAIDVGGAPPRRSIAMRPSRATAVLGYPVDERDVTSALARIGIAAEAAGGTVRVEVPGFRPDLESEIDIVEEVVRAHGYDRLPATVPGVRQAGGEQDSYVLRRRIRELLVRAGLREAASLSFASAADLRLLGHDDDPILVRNPPSADEPYLRTSLVPNLLRAAARNVERGARVVALFEVGHVFRRGDPVEEREHVAAVLAGAPGEGLHAPKREVDALDAKGALEVLLEGLGAVRWGPGAPAGPPFHPGRSCVVVVEGETVGTLGELHPSTSADLGIQGRAALFEIDVDALTPKLARFASFRDVPRYPPVLRDLAFILDEDVPAGVVREAIVESAGGLLDSCILFDVFSGPPLPGGKKSLAFSVGFRAPDRTLEGAEADSAVARIVERVAVDFGGELRTGA